ncbi:hypothetical protein, partial [Parasphingorhabdus sp.]|uniref:beta strand repeat-containing protein n=3 Tax=Parasphingorhabdus sp. TaxID=2709688 RepID=UPI00329A5550
MAGSSVTAAACLIAANPQAALAQTIAPIASPNRSFQASADFALGTGLHAISSNADTVTIDQAQTVINWSTLDTATLDTTSSLINLLADNTSVSFVGPSNGFTVLNRILPTAAASGAFREVAISGDVESRLGNIGGPIGGDLWFSSPGGILVSGTGTFDVGSLILTSNDIDITGGLFGPSGEVRFRGTDGSLSAVTIQENADINANTNGSYLALVAPHVVQGGNIDVDGSVAYVGAEQADLTINNGLFDIAITVGTGHSTGVEHTDTGITSGASSMPIADDPMTMGTNEANRDAQAIYMVAVPKNTAITMLVGGQIGYEAATTAGVVNGEVILSAGYNVSVGGSEQSAQIVVDTDPVNGIAGNITFTEGDIGADMTVNTTGSIDALIDGPTALNVGNGGAFADYNLTLTAGGQIEIGGAAGGALRVEGDLSARSGTNEMGGFINIVAQDDPNEPDGIGEIEIGGNFTADVSALGVQDLTPNTIPADVTAGSITVSISDNGNIDVTGDTLLDASAVASENPTFAGFAQAGDVSFTMTGGTSRFSGRQLEIDTTVGRSINRPAQINPANGNSGVAGDISFDVQAGTFTTTSLLGLNAEADAERANGFDMVSNDATAGNIDISFTGGTHSLGRLDVSNDAESRQYLDADGEEIYGLANGGSVNLLVDGAAVTATGGFFVDSGTEGFSPAGSQGSLDFVFQNGASFNVGSSAFISASTFAGNPSAPNLPANINITVDDSDFSFRRMSLESSTFASFGNGAIGTGANRQAGDINILVQNGGSFTGQSLDVSVNAFSGDSSDGGTASGGNILLSANNGSIALTSSLFADANGRGNSNPESDRDNRGSGFGGSIRFALDGQGASMMFNDVFADADGSIEFDSEGGGIAPSGLGGDGVGGSVVIDLNGGLLTGDRLNFGAEGEGG